MEENREKLTLRMSEELNLYTKKKANAIGVTQNAFLVMLIDMGLRQYEGELTIQCCCHGAESDHALFHTQKSV